MFYEATAFFSKSDVLYYGSECCILGVVVGVVEASDVTKINLLSNATVADNSATALGYASKVNLLSKATVADNSATALGYASKVNLPSKATVADNSATALGYASNLRYHIPGIW